jgi:hypothetical protein
MTILKDHFECNIAMMKGGDWLKESYEHGHST